jgi:hypothetical protein
MPTFKFKFEFKIHLPKFKLVVPKLPFSLWFFSKWFMFFSDLLSSFSDWFM